jgi:hypothetical protein
MKRIGPPGEAAHRLESQRAVGDLLAHILNHRFEGLFADPADLLRSGR